MPEIFFWIFATTLLLSGLGVVLSPRAMVSLLWMFGVILSASGLLAFMGAYLLSMILLLVYVGAILVLFTFVLMFVGQRPSLKKLGRVRLMMGGIAVVVFAFFLIPLLLQAPNLPFFSIETNLDDSSAYGLQLFGQYQFLVQMSGWLLLWVSVGTLRLLQNPTRNPIVQS